MKTTSFKFILLGILYFLWPGQMHAEMSRMQVGNQGLTIFLSDLKLESLRHGIKVFTEKTHKIKIHKRFFQKWANPDRRRGFLIAGVVVFVIGILVFTLYALATFLAFAVFDGAVGYLLLSLLFLGFDVLCILGMIKNSQNLRRMRHQEDSEEQFAPRPPSKNLKKQ